VSDQHPQHEEQQGSAPQPDLPETPEPLEFSQVAEPAHPDTPEADAEPPAPEPSPTDESDPAEAADPVDQPDPQPMDGSVASSSEPPVPEAAPVNEPIAHSPAEPETTAAEAAEPPDHSATAPESGAPTEPLDTAAEGVEDGLPPLSDADLDSALEALLLVVDSPVEEEALATAVDTTPLRVAEHLRLMSDRYTDQDRGIDLRRAGGGWRFYTRDRYAPYVEKLLLDGQRAKLTRAALETLAVIAYRQPVTRARVAAVRGVNCDGVIRTLLARGLVEETGTDVETGGFLYRTTELFLERLGLSSLDDLPPIAPLLPEVDSIDEL
jgi:segregation and condensation protein B